MYLLMTKSVIIQSIQSDNSSILISGLKVPLHGCLLPLSVCLQGIYLSHEYLIPSELSTLQPTASIGTSVALQ